MRNSVIIRFHRLRALLMANIFSHPTNSRWNNNHLTRIQSPPRMQLITPLSLATLPLPTGIALGFPKWPRASQPDKPFELDFWEDIFKNITKPKHPQIRDSSTGQTQTN